MTCQYCGGAMPSTKLKHAKYCSKQCRDKANYKKFMEGKSPEQRSAIYKKRNAAYRSKPHGNYIDHRAHAKARGVEFLLTFEEWWDIWKDYWDEKQIGNYVMCRTGDTGPYAVGNVRIDTRRNNALEAKGLLVAGSC